MCESGANEQLLGAAQKPVRSPMKICTKFGILRRREDPALRATCLSPDYARQCVNSSLRRLDVDHIDLYYVRRVDPDRPIEDTVDELSRLREAGLIAHTGLSIVDEAKLRRACAVSVRCMRRGADRRSSNECSLCSLPGGLALTAQATDHDGGV
jgi:aryl-alcohol dehydrogenase-like predicted oxidoreductase